MPYSEETLEQMKRPSGTKSYKQLMDEALTFNVTEYATFIGLGSTTAKKELTELVLAGKAEVVYKERNSTYYRLKPALLQPNDPFNLVKRGEPPVADPNAWMFGAQIS
jgi:predicted GH43/DUF377 family glycosyl hydrolase